MTWVRIDDRAASHPKLLRAGPEACWLWAAGLAWCNTHHTDGRIPVDCLGGLYGHRSWTPQRLVVLAKQLVVAGLWIEHAEHFEVHDYAHYQAEALRDVITARREAAVGTADADRQRKRRDAVRRAVLDRQKNRCSTCGAELFTPEDAAFPLVLSRKQGGKETAENLSAVCRECESGRRAQAPPPSRLTSRDDRDAGRDANRDGDRDAQGERPSVVTASVTHDDRDGVTRASVDDGVSRPVPSRPSKKGETHPPERHSSRPDISTENGRWAAWLVWKLEAGRPDDAVVHRTSVERIWQSIDRGEAARLRTHPHEAFERVCRAYLAWPPGKPLPGDKRPLKGERPASWLAEAVSAMVDWLIASNGASDGDRLRAEAERHRQQRMAAGGIA